MSDVVVVDEASAEVVRKTQSLLDEAARIDGQQAVSEQGRLQLRGGTAPGRAASAAAATAVNSSATHSWRTPTPWRRPPPNWSSTPRTADAATGGRSGSALLAASGKRLRVWAHGGHSAARHLAQVLGLDPLPRTAADAAAADGSATRSCPSRCCRRA